MNNVQQTARVGLFFLLGLALTWVTFQTLSGGKVFREPGYVIIAGFENLRELKKGDEVRMAGVKIGAVEETRLAGRRAEAVLRIIPTVEIREDATATIVMAGLIGTNYIGVSLGTATAPPLRAGAEITTKITPDLNSIMAEIATLGEKLEEALGSVGKAINGDGTGPGLFQKIDRLVTDNSEQVTATMANIRQVTEKLNRSESTLGKLINDPTLHDELLATIGEIKTGAADAKSFVANAQTILDQVKAGQGVIGTLVYDQKAGEDLKASIASFREMSDKISRGEGTLGKLISDDTILLDAQAIMKKADRALDGMGDSGPITAVGILANGLF